jgi:putative ABC transport system permease protein
MRLKEIGVRKVIGGLKRQLAFQFLSESVMMTVFAGLCSLLMYAVFQRSFESLFNTSLLSITDFPIVFWGYFFSLIIATGILPGLYPSLLLSSYKTVDSLKGKLKSVRSGSWLSRGLVTVQFTITIFVFICAIVINNQITMFMDSDLGYDKSYILTTSSVPRIYTPEGLNQMEAAKNEFRRLPEIENLSLSYEIPNGNNSGSINLYPEGGDKTKAVPMQYYRADEDFADVFRIGITEGTFIPPKGEWKLHDIVITEAAATALERGVGDRVKMKMIDSVTFTIRGIVKDFTQQSMHSARVPLAFMHPRDQLSYRFFSFRLKPGNIQESIAALGKKWHEVFPEDPFDYMFMDDRVAALYKTETQLQKAADIGTGVMAVIVAIGLLGMVSLAVTRRVKEIGVRKVLGASVMSILPLFSIEYVTIIAVSFAFAIPLAWLEVDNWLQGFAFKIELSWWMFAVPGLVLMILALGIISMITRKAAVSNPVDALRTE